jgi:bacteriorhodopsin
MPTADPLYLVYTIAMSLSVLLFFYWSRDPKGVHREEYLVATLSPVWSGLVYLAMAFGLGQTEIAGQTTYWARYVDWIITTPLLLLALAFTANHFKKKRNGVLIATVIAADVIMIVCGLVGDLVDYPLRYLFFAIGVLALVVIFYITWSPFRKIAYSEGNELGKVYDQVAGYLSLFWIAYPTVWLLGPSGLGVLSQSVDTWMFIILPFFSKVGFSVLDLYLLRKLSPTVASNPTVEGRPAVLS